MKNGRCVQYWYGGCDGNANSFDTLEECEGKCIKPNGTGFKNFFLILSLILIINNLKS